MLDILDRYKYGILAALAAYIVIYMYLQMESYTTYTPFEIFHDGSYVDIPEEDIHLQPENIDMTGFTSSDVKNTARDINDTRERSEDSYGYQSAADVEKGLSDLEKKYYEESGGAEEREKIKQTLQQTDNNGNDKAPDKITSNQGGNNAAGGEVMVDWSLSNRKPHQNNEWYVRNPGYTCGFAKGKVAVMIKVDQSGKVISATIDASKTTAATGCMIQQAKEYALKSRFNYSSSAPKSQTGYIYYTFVAQ